ncbi:hypothetical protein CAPTEDRAFT_218821 [Capitella teleta]|uniref:Uncharacterized protein n=1 Tax=Capitella teleta TaxID=283909 RepID=R7TH96_CAPTE|nr:hypothetical protein CAPTEDRAFT_218821 [Capitella teleta]|eukprot:ELT93089.1 hypothetical protein CAPTEDRAFT_218821 [Capitella teleta]
MSEVKNVSSSNRYKEYRRLLAPGPSHRPSANIRDPIIGTMAYSYYMMANSRQGSRPASQQQRAGYSYQPYMHEKSIFDHTGCPNSYFIIHPQWTSERASMRKMHSMERRHYDWANRPSHVGPPALVDNLQPMLQRKREQDSALRLSLPNGAAPRNDIMTSREHVLHSRMTPTRLERSMTWAPNPTQQPYNMANTARD